MQQKTNKDIFYVYRYFDPIKREYIYIGKGKGHRAKWHLSQRKDKSHLVNRIKSIRKQGAEPIVDFLCKNIDEEFAFLLEVEAIAKYGRRDIGKGSLLNRTDGGEGSSGPLSPEVLKKRQDFCKKNFSKPKSKEHCLKISQAVKHQDLTLQVNAMAEANRGKKRSLEIVSKVAEANRGSTRNEQSKQLMREKQLLQPRLLCVHCSGLFRPAAIGRYHGDKCKQK